MEAVQKLTRKFVPALRVMLGLLFLYAGAAKATDVAMFAAQIQRLGLENATLTTAFAHYLPFLEMICGMALLIRRFAMGATLLCVGLLVVFEGVMAYAWYHGYEGSCGYFGKFFGGTSIGAALIRNVGLLVIAATLLVHHDLLNKKGAE